MLQYDGVALSHLHVRHLAAEDSAALFLVRKHRRDYFRHVRFSCSRLRMSSSSIAGAWRQSSLRLRAASRCRSAKRGKRSNPLAGCHIQHARDGRYGSDVHHVVPVSQLPLGRADSPSPRVTEAASKITSITRSGAEYIGLWSTPLERTFAAIRPAINRCVFGLIMRSSSARKNQDGFDFHPGAGAFS